MTDQPVPAATSTVPLAGLALLPDGRVRRGVAAAATIAAASAAVTDQERNRRAVAAVTRRTRGHVLASPDDGRPEPAPTLRYLHDSSRRQTIVIAGHKMFVDLEREDSRRGDGSDGWSRLERIRFTAPTSEARKALHRFLEDVTDRHYDGGRPPQFRIASRWGGWDQRRDLPPRTLDTVILAEGQRERLVAELEAFVAQEDHYARIGAPWHRGYLFHGPPGSGKTSVAKALANHFQLDTYYVPLADLTADASLLNLVSNVNPRSVLLLEDIDVLLAAQDRDTTGTADPGGITLSGLLNALDGFATPHGLVVMMTTNRREILDEALGRKGRVDVDEHIGWLVPGQPDALFKMAYNRFPRARFDLPRGRRLVAVDLIEVFKQFPTDPDGAELAIAELLPLDRGQPREAATDDLFAALKDGES